MNMPRSVTSIPSSSSPSLPSSPYSRKILLIFDINGTLIDRLKSQDRPRFHHWRALPPDLKLESAMKVKTSHVVLRPGIRPFLERLLFPQLGGAGEGGAGGSGVRVAFWTSAEERNIRPILNSILPPPPPPAHATSSVTPIPTENASQNQNDAQREAYYRHLVEFMWYKPQCTITGYIKHKPQCIKDLRRVFSHHHHHHDHQWGGQWTERNVVLIDDSSEKVGQFRRNLLHIPTFYAALHSQTGHEHGIGTDPSVSKWRGVNEQNGVGYGQRDDVLHKLGAYLDRMMRDGPEDVRDYLERNPFRPV